MRPQADERKASWISGRRALGASSYWSAGQRWVGSQGGYSARAAVTVGGPGGVGRRGDQPAADIIPPVREKGKRAMLRGNSRAATTGANTPNPNRRGSSASEQKKEPRETSRHGKSHEALPYSDSAGWICCKTAASSGDTASSITCARARPSCGVGSPSVCAGRFACIVSQDAILCRALRTDAGVEKELDDHGPAPAELGLVRLDVGKEPLPLLVGQRAGCPATWAHRPCPRAGSSRGTPA